MVDFREIHDGERTIVKLTQKELQLLSNGKILKGFRVTIGIENED